MLKVLSLFDGMSCGQLALNKANIPYSSYYASEIATNAIKVTMDNFPKTIQLGDINNWNWWNINMSEIDLILGGFQCQPFSFAGNQLNFEDPRGKLFFVASDIINHIKFLNPNVKFLLENVKMKQEYKDVISSYLSVEPIEINSSLLSAQNRPRNYWTNIENITIPNNLGITFNDIRDLQIANYRYVPEEKTINRIYKTNYVQYDINGKGHNSQDQRAYYLNGKHGCLDTGASGKAKVIEADGKIRYITRNEAERLQTVPDNYTKIVSENCAKNLLGNGWTVDVIAHLLKNLK